MQVANHKRLFNPYRKEELMLCKRGAGKGLWA